MTRFLFTVFIVFLTSINSLIAMEKIVIRGANSSGIPILIKNISAEKVADLDLADKIIKLSDIQLKDSNLFEIVYDEKQKSILKKFFNPLHEPKFFPFELNLNLGVDAENIITAKIDLYDKRQEEYIFSEFLTSDVKQWQRISNQISNLIFYEFTGIQGIYDTQILFIAEKGKKDNRSTRIAEMDLYGSNFRYITNGKNDVLSPKYFGDKIYYSSYVGLRPKLYQYDNITNSAKSLTKKDTMEFSPNIGPSGEYIYYTEADNGNSDIMRLKIGKRKAKAISKSPAIDTSPAISPDGKKLAFISDRYGKAQIMLYDINDKTMRRLNIGLGSYQDPAWSPDGRYIAFVRVLNNEFSIGIINIQTLQSKILKEGYKIESPVFAPNSKYIMFSQKDVARFNKERGISNLYILDLNGNIIKKVATPTDASQADWRYIPD